MARRNRAANLRKELADVITELVDAESEAQVAYLLRDTASLHVSSSREMFLQLDPSVGRAPRMSAGRMLTVYPSDVPYGKVAARPGIQMKKAS